MINVVTNLIDVQETPAETDAPIDDGQGVVEATEALPEATPAFDEADLLDTSEIGDRMVRLTVDGEEVVVPLSEALNGYNSQAAATKRFQEASALKSEAEADRREAEQAVNLARAVSNDPGMTMKVLASQAQENQYQARQADEYLKKSLGTLQSQHGATPEDAQSVLRQAFEMKVGPEMFPMIYQAQQYQKSQATNSAQADASAAEAAETAARQQAAAQASNSVSTGSGAVGTAPAQVVRPMTAEQAIRATLDQFGVE